MDPEASAWFPLCSQAHCSSLFAQKNILILIGWNLFLITNLRLVFMWNVLNFGDISEQRNVIFPPPPVVHLGVYLSQIYELIRVFVQGGVMRELMGDGGGLSIYSLIHKFHLRGCSVCENQRFWICLRRVQSYWKKTVLFVFFHPSKGTGRNEGRRHDELSHLWK